jgi:hypothetical protein
MSEPKKYLVVPNTCVLVGGEAWPLARFVGWLIDNDHPRFNVNGKAIRAGFRVATAFDEPYSGKPGDETIVVALRPEDWEALKAAAEGPLVMHPQKGELVAMYPTAAARIWLGFVDRIAEARDNAPAVLVEAEAAE